MQASNIDQLDGVLAREREALLNADYDSLATLAVLKEQLLQNLAVAPPNRKELSRLKAKMQNNLDLTSAALRGIAAAQERITELHTVRDGLTTYDQSGRIAQVQKAQRKIEKRA